MRPTRYVGLAYGRGFPWLDREMQPRSSFYSWLHIFTASSQFSSVTHLCPTFCNPMDCSTPGFLVHHQLLSLLKLMSVESVVPSNHLILCRLLLLLSLIFSSIRVFTNESVLHIMWPKYGVSASTSVLPMTI